MDSNQIIYEINQLLAPLQKNIAEFQIDTNGLIEQMYKFEDKTGPDVTRLVNFILLNVPGSSSYLLGFPWETISLHPADGITYLHDTLVISFNVPITEEIKKRFNIPDGSYGPGFVMKFDLVDKTNFIKLYDTDIHSYIWPSVPFGTVFGYSHGVGVHFSDKPGDERCEYLDFYFVNPFRFFMRKFFKGIYPEFQEDFWALLRAYGLTVRNGKPIKLKRYIYWNDKGLFRLGRV